MKFLIFIFMLFCLSCEEDPGYEYIRCASACKISGLRMKECTSSPTSYSGTTSNRICVCGEPDK